MRSISKKTLLSLAAAEALQKWKESVGNDEGTTNEQRIQTKMASYNEAMKLYEADKKKNPKPSADEVWNLLPSSPPEAGNSFSNYSKATLRTALLSEQGFICAYCGSFIGDNQHVRLDHVIPKTLEINGVFDYDNLVAACSGGKYIWHKVIKGDTLASIAQQYGTNITTIRRLNELPNDQDLPVGLNVEVLIPVKMLEPHCDVKKGDEPHDIKPTDSDCQSHFEYSADGKIYGIGHSKEKAMATITTLGLNDNAYIKEKRRNQHRQFQKLLSLIHSPIVSKAQKKAILDKEKPTLTPEKLEEMIFVKQFWWKTLPYKGYD